MCVEALTLQKKMSFVAMYDAGVSLIYTSLTQTLRIVSMCFSVYEQKRDDLPPVSPYHYSPF
jgi:hypothetical protein